MSVQDIIQRYEKNPILMPGTYPWRRVVTFNPGVILVENTFYLFERACSSLAPLKCQFGLLKSTDGLHFEHVKNEPIFSPEDLGTPRGTVEDPRIVEIDGVFYMNFVHRNFASICRPNGVGVPDYIEAEGIPADDPNTYRSGIATSTNLIDWTVKSIYSPPDIHERDDVLFPRRISGRFAMLRRPDDFVGPQYGCEAPSIWMSYSDDLTDWSAQQLVATPAYRWESKKIGAASPPIATDAGWLAFHHGVDENSTYRLGALLLDGEDPTRLLARTPEPLMEPETYYEKVGLIIPNVIFPTAAVLRGSEIFIYYGCADTCISVAKTTLGKVLDALQAV